MAAMTDMTIDENPHRRCCACRGRKIPGSRATPSARRAICWCWRWKPRRDRRHGIPAGVPPDPGTLADLRRGNGRAARHRQGRDRCRGDLGRSVASTTTYGRGGIAAMAMSALDIALWDAVGKRAGSAAASPVGTFPRRAAGLWQRLLPRQRRRRHDRQGAALQVARLQGDQDAGRAQGRICAPISTMCGGCARRSAPDIDIMIDVNMGWTADVAIQMGRKFEDYDVYWLEEPVEAGRFQRLYAGRGGARPAHRRRRDAFHPFRSHALLREPLLPILQPDPCAAASPTCAKPRRYRRHHGDDDRAASVPRAEQPPAGLDPERLVDRGHGAFGGFMGRARPRGERHDHARRRRPGHGLSFKPEILRDCAVR